MDEFEGAGRDENGAFPCVGAGKPGAVAPVMDDEAGMGAFEPEAGPPAEGYRDEFPGDGHHRRHSTKLDGPS